MSTVTHFNPDSIYGFDSASTGSVLTKGSSSSITFQNISAIVPSNVSYFTNDAGYINSAVTQMANYATSANVVTALDNKVDKVNGKGLSTNDYTNNEKRKLADIQERAEKNQNAFSTITYGDEKIKASSTEDTLQLTTVGSIRLGVGDSSNTLTIVGEDKLSYLINDAGFINSAVTSMTNYATSADVVNSLNIVNNELPMSVYLFVNSSSGTAESYRDRNGSEPISVREIVEYLNSGRTVEFYSRPIPWAGGQTPYTRLDNVMFGIGYIMPSGGRTYRIYGEAFNYGNNKQYNFEAIDSTQDANPNYTWSATTTTSKGDYATKTYVDNAVSNIDDTIYIDGSGNTFTVYKADDELYNLIVSDVRPNAVLMYNTNDSNTPIPMLCYFYNRQITNSGNSVSLRLNFVSSIEHGDVDLMFKRYDAMVIINMQKIYVDNVFQGYAINIYGSASFGYISMGVPIPSAMQAGQLLSVSSAGTYEVTPIFTYTPNSVATASTVSINFNSFRNSQMITISGNTNFIFNVDNQADNILWVYNSGTTDITFGISGVTYYGNNVTMFGFPKDWLTFASGQMAEIGLICDDDGAKFTWRDDLSWTSILPS